MALRFPVSMHWAQKALGNQRNDSEISLITSSQELTNQSWPQLAASVVPSGLGIALELQVAGGWEQDDY